MNQKILSMSLCICSSQLVFLRKQIGTGSLNSKRMNNYICIWMYICTSTRKGMNMRLKMWTCVFFVYISIYTLMFTRNLKSCQRLNVLPPQLPHTQTTQNGNVHSHRCMCTCICMWRRSYAHILTCILYHAEIFTY